ncbi:PREDICTED: crossover junction endonuclease EME1-like, partial [Nanorana parkeri]|uniref:crossover junction endonuclease EME1-like n=1 Tax=Nanorana parkeri TaxID=125878 RepID=UPI0008547ADF
MQASMGSSSDSSDSEDLPRLPFLASTARRPVAVARPSSNSESEQEDEDLPLFRRLAAPPSRGAPGPREPSARPVESREPAWASKICASRDPARAPQPKSAAPRDPARAPQPKKAKKSPESLTVHIDTVLLQDGSGGQVLNALQAQDYKCVIQSQPVARSITWSRSGEDVNVSSSSNPLL